MSTRDRLNSLLTKRTLVVGVVVIAVIGAGFGFVSPPSNDSVDDPAGSELQHSETTKFTGGQTAEDAPRGVTATATESAPEREFADDATDRTRTVSEETTTTQSTTQSASEARDDDSDERSGDENDDASVTVQFEGNATVGSLSDYPSMSLTLNAVVNAPNTANTAGGA